MLINMDDYKHTKMRVLFLCIGNSCRSQMAEALLRKHAPNRFSAFSAGIEPSTVNPYTIRVLQEMGVDTSDLFSKSLSKFFKAPAFDYLITVCSDAEERCPVFPGAGKRCTGHSKILPSSLDPTRKNWLNSGSFAIRSINASATG